MQKKLGILCGLSLAALSLSCRTTHPLINFSHNKSVRDIKAEAKKYTDKHGRVQNDLQLALYKIEEERYGNMSTAEQLEFQQMVAEFGGMMVHPVKLPREETPFWLLEKGPLWKFRSSNTVPRKADIVIIGAGLTGSSAAYHLSDEAKKGRTILVLEAEDQPASQSSGRNGGNFQLLAESYVDTYEGMVEERIEALKKISPTISSEKLLELGRKQTSQILTFKLHNFNRFRDLVRKENIDCDFSEKGWLRFASSENEEKALLRDTEWLTRFQNPDLPKIEWIRKEEIEKRFGVPAKFSGRFIAKNGNYHPYKFVTQILQKSVEKGVRLYTNVRVQNIRKEKKKILLESSEGKILADKVIVATNAQTSKLIPEMKAIYVVPSQVMNLEHVKNALGGSTITEQDGDIYYNFPLSKQYKDEKGVERGMVHFGLDFPKPADGFNIPRSEEHFQKMKVMTDERFPDTVGQPASRVWTGPMAFTPDRVPVIGFWNSKQIVIAAGFQGYGGSYCTQAGFVAAQMALTGTVHEDVPEDVFSPMRFVKRDQRIVRKD